MQDTYKIGEVAARLDLKTYVLRFWETEFPQIVPLRTEKGQRLYTAEHVGLLRRIRHLLHERGLTIEGARKVLSDEASRGVAYSEDGAYLATKAWLTYAEAEAPTGSPSAMEVFIPHDLAPDFVMVENFGLDAEEEDDFTFSADQAMPGSPVDGFADGGSEELDEILPVRHAEVLQGKQVPGFQAVHLTLPGCPAPPVMDEPSVVVAEVLQDAFSVQIAPEFDNRVKTNYLQTEFLRTVIQELEAVKKILELPPNEISK